MSKYNELSTALEEAIVCGEIKTVENVTLKRKNKELVQECEEKQSKVNDQEEEIKKITQELHKTKKENSEMKEVLNGVEREKKLVLMKQQKEIEMLRGENENEVLQEKTNAKKNEIQLKKSHQVGV